MRGLLHTHLMSPATGMKLTSDLMWNILGILKIVKKEFPEFYSPP
jgi:hypothetical protein